MPDKFNRINSRYEQRAKRRKTNIVLNTLIAIVVILILIVGGNIFLTDSKTEKEMKEAAKTEAQTKENQQSDDKQDKTDKAGEEEDADEEKETDENAEDEEVIEEDSDEANVDKVINDPSWKPVGTEQSGDHQYSSEMGSTDWNEKEKAAAYAIGISPDSMTNWWTRKGDDTGSQAVMTVSESSKPNEAYRVYLEWVDGEGWKPTEVKKLIENDKGQE
ncbi:hypothetical protein J14TS2_14900 [Bacillus sp. J14TS2]|uniref:YrrS family protein n=1 Tax=Bacillus sp. J14TS2 TaxID=2807188 RepID=UPI001B157BDE|nr:YrrS family protein [Bacillus sp. J14TS2]GIN71015.1 hypothetical protein J14TS2_14900 [Bacillus sp. J14TS2]